MLRRLGFLRVFVGCVEEVVFEGEGLFMFPVQCEADEDEPGGVRDHQEPVAFQQEATDEDAAEDE